MNKNEEKILSELHRGNSISHIKERLYKGHKIKFLLEEGDIDREITKVAEKLDKEISFPYTYTSLHSSIAERVVREIVFSKVKLEFEKKYRKRLGEINKNLDQLSRGVDMFGYLERAGELFVRVFPLEMIFLFRFMYEVSLRDKIIEELRSKGELRTSKDVLKMRKKLEKTSTNLEKVFVDILGGKGEKIINMIHKMLEKKVGKLKGFILDKFIHGNFLTIANYVENEKRFAKVIESTPSTEEEAKIIFHLAPYIFEKKLLQAMYEIAGILYLSQTNPSTSPNRS